MINHKNVARIGICALIGIVTMGFAPAFDHRVKVESNGGKTVRHNESLGSDVTVRLVRQLSDAPCIEGRTWGWDRRGIWVSRGCRAEFEILSRNSNRERDRRGRGNGRGVGGVDNRGGYSTRITLGSNGDRRNVYRSDKISSVRLVRQLSSAPCREGQSWGWTRDSVWVSDGCRAIFDIVRH